jgi:hypothetical protein
MPDGSSAFGSLVPENKPASEIAYDPFCGSGAFLWHSALAQLDPRTKEPEVTRLFGSLAGALNLLVENGRTVPPTDLRFGEGKTDAMLAYSDPPFFRGRDFGVLEIGRPEQGIVGERFRNKAERYHEARHKPAQAMLYAETLQLPWAVYFNGFLTWASTRGRSGEWFAVCLDADLIVRTFGDARPPLEMGTRRLRQFLASPEPEDTFASLAEQAKAAGFGITENVRLDVDKTLSFDVEVLFIPSRRPWNGVGRGFSAKRSRPGIERLGAPLGIKG